MNDNYFLIPCVRNRKFPSLPWKYLKRQPQITQFHNVAALCGRRSNGLWIIDLDLYAQANYKVIVKYLVDSLNIMPFGVNTPSGGKHLHFLIEDVNGVPPSRKLARSAGRQVIVETRGEGGYALVPPSVVNGVPYQIQKTFGKPKVPTITVEQMNELERFCHDQFNQYCINLGS